MTQEQRYAKFTADMQAAGREVENYRGRFFYDGPSTQCPRDELQTVIRETSVQVQWDSMGRDDIVVYPA